jgi:hypothetical protein
MIILHIVINGFWSGFSPAVSAFLRADFEEFSQAAALYFPIKAKCDFSKFGVSGSVENRDAICLLPQNVINEKVFVLLYVWYLFILFCALINMMYLLMMFSFKMLRLNNLGRMIEKDVTFRFLRDISSDGDYGLWFTLRTFCINLTPIYFQDFCFDLQMALRHDNRKSKLQYDDDDIEKYSM